MRPRAKREAWMGLLLISPWLVGLLAFTAGPMVVSFLLSLAKWDILSPPTFVGLSNFQQILYDQLFSTAVYNTLIYTLVNVPLSFTGTLNLALFINRR